MQTCVQTCVDMCVDMCVGMFVDLCADMDVVFVPLQRQSLKLRFCFVAVKGTADQFLLSFRHGIVPDDQKQLFLQLLTNGRR